MNKFKAKAVINDLEKKIDAMLPKWSKEIRVGDEASIELVWRWNQAQLLLFIFYVDSQEGIRLQLISPYTCCKREWREVSGRIADSIIDTVGTFATIAINEKAK